MGTDEHTYKGTFGETPEQFTARMHIVRGEVKLTHAGVRQVLEAQVKSTIARCATMVSHLEAECAAWREMARAERHAAGARMYGSGEQQAEALWRVGVAESALRELGIDPHA